MVLVPQKNVKIPSEIRKADRALFKIGKSVEILNRLKWDAKTKKAFLKSWRSGATELPKITYSSQNLFEKKKALKDVIKSCSSSDPLANIVRETAGSYLMACRMLEHVGSNRFLEFSTEIYGAPKDNLGPSNSSTYKAADHFLKKIEQFDLAQIVPKEAYCILPETVLSSIQKVARKRLKGHPLKVVSDPRLASKASAGINRIRVRAQTCFASHDVDQLIEHELLVHTLTLANGRLQPLKVLGLNSPRISCSQEGLAVFAEFITNAIDVSRLRRISARVAAIQMGIDGANFIEVFEFFLEQGQSEEESFHSAMRVFRGGKVKGGSVFTKDIVYLKGFIEVHSFFLNSLKAKRFIYPDFFFAGRMKTEDVSFLYQEFEKGLLDPPRYKPEWITNKSTLLAFLLSSSVMNNLGLSEI